MRISSKSILSPGRSDKPPISLSTSLSRRLRSNNGSLKGGQSPMFPPGVNSKKRGCAFENPEPSSPKVTCIGQVRVKTKKQGKKMKMAYRARRITTTFNERNHELKEGESKNQSWAQFPVTICDAFSCFIPCKSGEGNKAEKRENSSSSCYRWFVAFNGGGGGEGKTRDIEIVVGEEEGRMEEERVVMEREFPRRRSIFDDMDFNVDEICDGGGGGEGKNEGSRVSICVPPKNALLLMRCRSDPVKMSALVEKFWESPIKEDDEEDEEIEQKKSSVREEEKIEAFSNCDEIRVREEAEDVKIESLSNSDGVGEDQKLPEGEGEEEEEKEENGESATEDVDQERISVSVSDDGFMNLAILFEEQDPDGMEKKERRDFGQSHDPPESTPPIEHFQEEEEEEDLVEIQETVIGKDSIFEYNEEDNNQPPPLESQEEEMRVAENQSRSEEQSPISNEEEDEEEEKHSEAMEKPVLPDCLLLMMCDPKLSMEVSKETWVCSTDLLRPWLPERHRQHQLKKLTGTGDEPNNNKKKKSKKNRGGNTDSHPPLPPAAAQPAPFQPTRSSCSFPISMASLVEKKLVSAVAYEPFVLTRCKSEPMRTASAKLGAGQEVACFWRNIKIEPHKPATCAIGAAGVGF